MGDRRTAVLRSSIFAVDFAAPKTVAFPEKDNDLATQDERIKGLETQTGNIRDRLSRIEGQLEARANAKSPNAILIAVLSIVGVGVIGYLGWVGTQIVDQGRQISQILSILSPDIIKKASSQPENPKSAHQVEQVVRKAMKQGERLDPSLVSEAGTKFADASVQNPDAWQAASSLLNYKSFLEVSIPSQEPPKPIDPTTISTRYKFHSVPGSVDGKVYVLGVSRPPNVAELHLLGEPDQNANLNVGAAFLLITDAQLILDGVFYKNVIFQNTHIVYNGGPVVLQNVYFVNCTFDVKPNPPRALDFAKAVFNAHPAVSFTAT